MSLGPDISVGGFCVKYRIMAYFKRESLFVLLRLHELALSLLYSTRDYFWTNTKSVHYTQTLNGHIGTIPVYSV